MAQNKEYLIWIDLEMTGLDLEQDVIIEIATIITDQQLNIIQEGPNLTLHQPEAVLSQMDEWNTRQHHQSGLADQVRASCLSEEGAEHITLEFIKKYVPAAVSPMCGNSICQDRRFLWRYMPELEKYFHYRNLDVSTVKELARRWAPHLAYQKESSHRALDDIRQSIAELQYYRAHFLNLA